MSWSNNDKDYKNKARPYPVTMIISGRNFNTEVRKTQPPVLEKNK